MFLCKYTRIFRCGILAAFLAFCCIPEVLAQTPSGESGSGLRVIGNVTDDKGEPLVGATVYAKNDKSVNAITDLDGNYEITVPEKWTVLVYDFVGFITKEETVGERNVP